MLFFSPFIGCSKSGVCDNSHEYSISLSNEGLLGRWKNHQTASPCSSSSSKRVVVVVDEGREAKVALLWALSHVLHYNSHTLTLLHILDNRNVTWFYKYRGYFADRLFWKNNENMGKKRDKGISLIKSLEAICKSYCPEVQVEVVMAEGKKISTTLRWVKKLEASMLVVGQKKPSMFHRIFGIREEDMVDFCNANGECLTVGVRRRSSRIGGYIINSREVKNFWLLA